MSTLATGRHMAVDLETLGKTSGAVIGQIGACEFFPAEMRVGRTYSRYIDLGSSFAAGRMLDPSTLMFWIKQGNEARDRMFSGMEAGESLKGVLLDFNDWCQSENGLQGMGRRVSAPYRTWAHGPSFDVAIMESTYDAVGIKPPWGYSSVRDTRTIFEAAGRKMHDEDKERIFRDHWPENVPSPVNHDARSDSVVEAILVMESLADLGLASRAASSLAVPK